VIHCKADIGVACLGNSISTCFAQVDGSLRVCIAIE